MFADDTTSACDDVTIDGLMVKAQKMVSDIHRWSNQNYLTIHSKKSILMILSSKTFTGPLPQILLDDSLVSIVLKAKCLGVVIDDKLS